MIARAVANQGNALNPADDQLPVHHLKMGAGGHSLEEHGQIRLPEQLAGQLVGVEEPAHRNGQGILEPDIAKIGGAIEAPDAVELAFRASEQRPHFFAIGFGDAFTADHDAQVQRLQIHAPLGRLFQRHLGEGRIAHEQRLPVMRCDTFEAFQDALILQARRYQRQSGRLLGQNAKGIR